MDARTEFGQLVQQVTSFVGDRDLDAALAADLNDAFGYGSEMHDSLARLIHAGESEGWLLAREAGGIKFGRPVKPGQEAGHFSVDVVHMADIRGPHHIHVSGEIGVMFPLEGRLPSMVAVMPGMSIHRQAIITRQSPAAQRTYSIFYRMVPSNSPEDESDDGSARRSCRHEGRGNE